MSCNHPIIPTPSFRLVAEEPRLRRSRRLAQKIKLAEEKRKKEIEQRPARLKEMDTKQCMRETPKPALPKGVVICDFQPKPENIWTFHRTQRIEIPAGTYYVGDHAYALSVSDYDEMLKSEGNHRSGLYAQGDNFVFCGGVKPGASHSYYRASDGKIFHCASGSLALVSLPLKKRDMEGGRIYTFPDDTICDFNCGVFRFIKRHTGVMLSIDTNKSITPEEYYGGH